MLLSDLIFDKEYLDLKTIPQNFICIHNNRPLEMAIEMMNDHKVDSIVLLDENDKRIGVFFLF